MRKRIYVSIIMLILCCIFTSNIFATSTTISIDIYEIKINCGNNGSFSISGDTYSGTQSVMRKKGDSVEIKFVPNNKYKIESIVVDTTDNIVLGEDTVTVEEIDSSVTIDVTFKRKNSGSNADVEPPREEQPPIDPNDHICDGIHNCISKPYVDIDTKEWYHHDIDYVMKNELMIGTGEKEFEPHASTTRAMIVTVLHRLENKPATTVYNVFDDVEKGTWYTDSINWASSVGVVLGYGDGTFGPDDPITREQMVAILYRYTKYKLGTMNVETTSNKFFEFDDVEDISPYAYEPMKWACSQGIIIGDNNRLLPQGISERCQIAAMLHRFCTTILK